MTDIPGFLAKGGLVLGVVAFSQANGIDRWEMLGPALRHPVKRLSNKLKTSDDVVQMAKAVIVATTGSIQPAVPPWVLRCVESPERLATLGNSLSFAWPPGNDSVAPAGLAGGVLGLAIALCRNSDLVLATSRLLPEASQQTFRDGAAVAAVLAAPGMPSRMRSRIKSCVAQLSDLHMSQPDDPEAG